VSPLSLALVLLSAGAHVYWNYRLKQARDPLAYSWWVQALGAVLAAPIAVCVAWPPRVPLVGWACVVGTGAIYALYFALIAASYRSEDLSRAYPIARGVAPLVTAVWGVLLYHERPSIAGWAGILAISLGVLALAYPAFRDRRTIAVSGLLAAVGTGLCTSGYSAVDKLGVRHVHPVLYIALTFAAGALFQLPMLLRDRKPGALLTELRLNPLGVARSSAFALASYLLILFVLQIAPISYVVSLRSVSVLIGIAVGARVLKETEGVWRFGAGLLIVAGIVAIAVAG
jgi:drug/metabolite transporter (DMT)-like permease